MSKVETLSPGASWEKSGNTSWVQCPGCSDWFHVGSSILARAEVKLHCPHCARAFLSADAPRLIKAG